MDLSQFDYAPLALAFVHVVLGVLVLILAKFVKEWLSPYSLDQELTSRDNPAFGLAVAGYYGASVIIYLGASVAGPLPLDAGTTGVLAALGIDLAWAVGGILALNAVRWLMDVLLVADTHNSREIIEHRNTAAGVIESCGYIAAALVLAGAIRQPGGNAWTAIALFLLGLAALILIGRLYQRLTGYDVAAEIRKGNFPAGVAFGMTLIAIALLMMKATSGDFVDWKTSLSFFVFDAVAGLLLLRGLRWLTDLALFPHVRSAEEIVRDRNVNVGLIEGVMAVGIAAIILFLF
jgi:uncharacterized membrane protein YjfL (UPF0719 family)